MNHISNAFSLLTKSNNNSSNNGRKQQMQQQCHLEKQAQIQKTKEIQMFKEQVGDTFDAVSIAAEMSQNGVTKESTINRLTDGAILSLNAWLVSCDDMIKDRNKTALEIAEKEINDKWDQLKMTDETTFNLTIKHRDYMIAALHGEAKKFDRRRTKSSNKKLFNTNTKTINQTFGRLIVEQQQYDQHIKTFDDPNVSKKLQQQHAADLKIIRERAKNNINNKSHKKNKYKQVKQSELYFTKSGQNGTFKRRNHDSDQKDMDDALFGADNAYDKLPKMQYKNAAIIIKKLTSNSIKYFPCLIMEPVQDQLDKICVTPAYPYDNQTKLYPAERIECNADIVEKAEIDHINEHGKLYPVLGHQSINQQKDAKLNKDNQIADEIINGDIPMMQSSPFHRNQKIVCIDKNNQKRNAKIRAIVNENGGAVNVMYESNNDTEWIASNQWKQRIFPRNNDNSQKKESMNVDS